MNIKTAILNGNSRLTVLTILSAIFLPLTLIAGIYGMNFQHMPELDNQYAYFVILGLMLVVALGMLFFSTFEAGLNKRGEA